MLYVTYMEYNQPEREQNIDNLLLIIVLTEVLTPPTLIVYLHERTSKYSLLVLADNAWRTFLALCHRVLYISFSSESGVRH